MLSTKGSNYEEKLVHVKMVVKFEVLSEKKKMCYLGLRRFDLWMEFLMVHLEELEMKKWCRNQLGLDGIVVNCTENQVVTVEESVTPDGGPLNIWRT
ncbi:hypothetical protein Tco_0559466 [Tanacetum coccineum]